MNSSQQYERSQGLPVPTPWPIVLALGITLLFAGVVTSGTVSILGAVLCLSAFAGRFRNSVSKEMQAAISVAPQPATVTTRSKVDWGERISQNANETLPPFETYPLSAGAKGGLAGSVVMAAVALLYGLASRHGIGYPINLLASAFLPVRKATEQTAVFHWDALIIASAVYLVASLLVGLLYAVTLPLCPCRPVLFGGLVAPLFWSGLIHGFLGTVSPMLNQHIQRLSFFVCQVGFGLVAGIVVSRQERLRPWQHLPVASRAGMGFVHPTKW